MEPAPFAAGCWVALLLAAVVVGGGALDILPSAMLSPRFVRSRSPSLPQMAHPSLPPAAMYVPGIRQVLSRRPLLSTSIGAFSCRKPQSARTSIITRQAISFFHSINTKKVRALGHSTSSAPTRFHVLRGRVRATPKKCAGHRTFTV